MYAAYNCNSAYLPFPAREHKCTTILCEVVQFFCSAVRPKAKTPVILVAVW